MCVCVNNFIKNRLNTKFINKKSDIGLVLPVGTFVADECRLSSDFGHDDSTVNIVVVIMQVIMVVMRKCAVCRDVVCNIGCTEWRSAHVGLVLYVRLQILQ